MTLEPELVFRKIALMGPDLEELARLAALDVEAYLADERNEWVAERLLERVITRMIDVNYHLLTAAGRPPPADYHASFVALGSAGILEPQFARSLARCAGLRNRIAHLYDEIDARLIHAALGDAVADIPRYLEAVRAHVDGQG